MYEGSRIVLVTGAQAAGKSTVARLLADRCARSVLVDGDQFWAGVIGGRADMSPRPTPEALLQLQLRYRAMAAVAAVYAPHGFRVLLADNVFGDDIRRLREYASPWPVTVVLLRPSLPCVVERDGQRAGSSYGEWIPAGGTTLDAVRAFDALVQRTAADLTYDSSNEDQVATANSLWHLLGLSD